MDILTICLIALGLAMDAFAVSIASGVIIKREKIKRAMMFGAMFGGFQMGMPLVGYGAGRIFQTYITTFDHWVAFGLLVFIGAKMIYEATRLKDIEQTGSALTTKVLLGLSIATSIDALAVGVSFACLKVAIFVPALIIGGITFFMSFIGVLLGNAFGALFEKKVEILGGLVLMGMGVKILIEHFLM